MGKDFLPEEELIEYLKPRLKAMGFKKKGKRWTKTTDEFTMFFFIQGSSFSKEDYYIRPGISINRFIETVSAYYGHVWKQISITTPERVLSEFEEFCKKWTDKKLFKEKLSAFIAWDQRFPLEKRRQLLEEYCALHGAYPTAEHKDDIFDGDLCPAEELFGLSYSQHKDEVFAYILDNYG